MLSICSTSVYQLLVLKQAPFFQKRESGLRSFLLFYRFFKSSIAEPAAIAMLTAPVEPKTYRPVGSCGGGVDVGVLFSSLVELTCCRREIAMLAANGGLMKEDPQASLPFKIFLFFNHLNTFENRGENYFMFCRAETQF